MGRIIKKEEINREEQSDVTSAPLSEEFQDGATRGSSSSRIPRENVLLPQDANHSPDRPTSKGPVLEPDQIRQASESFQVEPVEPTPVSSSADPPAEQPEETEDPDHGDEKNNDAPERTDAEWQEHLEEMVEEARVEGYEKGYSEGYDDGYDEAEASARAEWEEEREALISDINGLEEAWTQYIDDNESRMVELTLQLAEAIVDAPFSDSLRQASEEAIIEAVAELAGTPPLTVTVHPVDYQRLQESGLAEHLTDKYAELQLESDPDHTEGDWTVASPAGAIRRRRSEVIDTLRDRLHLSSTNTSEA
jgi:flagellar biosynthesis/type III secretory pathway protein FliH